MNEQQRKAMEQALEALENHSGNYKLSKAECVKYEAVVEAIKEALASEAKEQPAQQEPVYKYCDDGKVIFKNPEILSQRAKAQQEQSSVSEHLEPVAWGLSGADGFIFDVISPEEHAREEGGYTTPLYTPPPQRKPMTGKAKAVIDAARAAMDDSVEAYDLEDNIIISSELAASLSLCLDEYDRAIEAAHGIRPADLKE